MKIYYGKGCVPALLIWGLNKIHSCLLTAAFSSLLLTSSFLSTADAEQLDFRTATFMPPAARAQTAVGETPEIFSFFVERKAEVALQLLSNENLKCSATVELFDTSMQSLGGLKEFSNSSSKGLHTRSFYTLKSGVYYAVLSKKNHKACKGSAPDSFLSISVTDYNSWRRTLNEYRAEFRVLGFFQRIDISF